MRTPTEGSPLSFTPVPPGQYHVRYRLKDGETFTEPVIGWAVVVRAIEPSDDDEYETEIQPVVLTDGCASVLYWRRRDFTEHTLVAADVQPGPVDVAGRGVLMTAPPEPVESRERWRADLDRHLERKARTAKLRAELAAARIYAKEARHQQRLRRNRAGDTTSKERS